jgi:hypothetical protein
MCIKYKRIWRSIIRMYAVTYLVTGYTNELPKMKQFGTC